MDAQITRAPKESWAPPTARQPLPARVCGETVSKRRRPPNALRVMRSKKRPEPPCRRRMGSARAAPPGPEEARETEAPRASQDPRRRLLRAQDRLLVTRLVELVLFESNPQAQRQDGTLPVGKTTTGKGGEARGYDGARRSKAESDNFWSTPGT